MMVLKYIVVEIILSMVYRVDIDVECYLYDKVAKNGRGDDKVV